jgi:flagellar biosynthetic protein FliR
MATVPWRIRIALAISVAILVTGTLGEDAAVPTSLVSLAFLGGAEVLLGIAVGFTASLFIHGVRMAGQLAGIQMGLGFSSLVDPMTGDQTTVLARFMGLSALMVVLAFNGHLILLRGVAYSFHQLPPGAAWMSLAHVAAGVPSSGATLFVTALLVAAPALVTVFCLKMGMALLARAAPQMHILAVGFIVTIVVGVITIALTLTSLGDTVRSGFEQAAGRALELCAVR